MIETIRPGLKEDRFDVSIGVCAAGFGSYLGGRRWLGKPGALTDLRVGNWQTLDGTARRVEPA